MHQFIRTPATRSISKDQKQHHATSSVDETPTFVTLLHAIDQLNTILHTGIQEVKLAISNTNVNVDLKIATVINLTRQLLHQQFCHCSDKVLDTMCRN